MSRWIYDTGGNRHFQNPPNTRFRQNFGYGGHHYARNRQRASDVDSKSQRLRGLGEWGRRNRNETDYHHLQEEKKSRKERTPAGKFTKEVDGLRNQMGELRPELCLYSANLHVIMNGGGLMAHWASGLYNRPISDGLVHVVKNSRGKECMQLDIYDIDYLESKLGGRVAENENF